VSSWEKNLHSFVIFIRYFAELDFSRFIHPTRKCHAIVNQVLIELVNDGTIEYVACGKKVENTAFPFTLEVRHLYDAAETLIRQPRFACWLLRLPQDTSQ
jgi:hypothetical protein